jgi:UPF0271 protein
MGELPDPATDLALLAVVTSANIACGAHAGDAETMRKTVDAAIKQGVAIGAHPSFEDREGFGRRELSVPPGLVVDQVFDQIGRLGKIAHAAGGKLHHVKPHGALYNMAARDAELARAIARAVRDYDANLKLYGLAGSFLLSEARAAGLQPISEVFADRTYRADGSLTPRSAPGAMIEDEEASIRQVWEMLTGFARTTEGARVSIQAETLCLHGDQPKAVLFAHHIRRELEARGIAIAAPR